MFFEILSTHIMTQICFPVSVDFKTIHRISMLLTMSLIQNLTVFTRRLLLVSFVFGHHSFHATILHINIHFHHAPSFFPCTIKFNVKRVEISFF